MLSYYYVIIKLGVVTMKRISIEKLRDASEKGTDLLVNEIMRTENIDDYLEKNGEFLNEASLSAELCRLLEEKGLKKADVIAASGITATYAYDLFSGYKNKKPSRNIILALCFAMGLDVEDTQKLLKISDHGALYPRVPRDSVIMFAIKSAMTRCEADDLLSEKGMETLV